MESILKADIFFVITTLVVIAIAIGLIILLIYVIRIVRTVEHIAKRVRDESDKIIDDVDAVRGQVKRVGKGISRFL